jgi:hypothetical protein
MSDGSRHNMPRLCDLGKWALQDLKVFLPRLPCVALRLILDGKLVQTADYATKSTGVAL